MRTLSRNGPQYGAMRKRKNTKANMGLIFGIVVEKNQELPEHDPNRKYKGRATFQGNSLGRGGTLGCLSRVGLLPGDDGGNAMRRCVWIDARARCATSRRRAGLRAGQD